MKKIEKELAKYFLKENDFVNIDNMKVKVLYLCNTKTFKSSEYDFVCTKRYVAYGKNKLLIIRQSLFVFGEYESKDIMANPIPKSLSIEEALVIEKTLSESAKLADLD